MAKDPFDMCMFGPPNPLCLQHPVLRCDCGINVQYLKGYITTAFLGVPQG